MKLCVINRLLLAELLRLRLREVYKDVKAPLVYDLPHNITLPKGQRWVTRKGASPAHVGQPVIIPGSMGAYSYLMVGRGNPAFCNSASHGAGSNTVRISRGGRGGRGGS
ncbi:RtcB family protein [Nostoc favosum]|uniref:RtcB family protein n=1 Tax=Nostoc favosum TaxID=2907819 RepID=UPI003F68B604